MKIRKKILLYFSVTTILLTGITLLFIYTLFSAYREEEFQQRLKDKITYTVKFLGEVQQTDNNLLRTLDRVTINDLYQEKVLLFDARKQLIYASLDDTKIIFSKDLLHELTKEHPWIERKEGDFDVVAVYVAFHDHDFYGICKAYDTFGYTKLNYLRYILLGAFLFILVVTLIVTFYLSREISLPINRMATEISNLQPGSDNAYITVPHSEDEINYLARKFNELMKRLHDAFSFQKHAVHHISHELKTPIAVLVSNFEKIEKEQNSPELRKWLNDQKEGTKNLGDIINALLEIAKTETGNIALSERVRVDDLILDIIEELKLLHEDFDFQVDLQGNLEEARNLELPASRRLLKLAFINLMINCIQYSDERTARIEMHFTKQAIRIAFMNRGAIVQEAEKPFLFRHFFRGYNSKGRRGFGLGLVLTHKIIQLHRGTITYEHPDPHTNIFTLLFPLS